MDTRLLGETFVIRQNGLPVWQVSWHGRVCSPMWMDKGPAEAYLDALRKGTRDPEYHACSNAKTAGISSRNRKRTASSTKGET